MSKDMKIDDAMLHAYVDGELDPDAIAEVETWLRQNPADQTRVATWQRQAQALKQAFDPVLAEPLPPEWQTAINRTAPARYRFWAAQALAAGILLAVGAFGGWYFSPTDPVQTTAIDSIVDQAQSAYTVYVSEVRRPVEVAATEKDQLITWLSKRLGQPLSAPDLSATGFFLLGGRLLPENNKPAAQFMYENDRGERVTLYVAINPSGQETAFRIASNETTRSFYWLDGPLGFAVTGEFAQPDLLKIARNAYEQLALPS